MLVNAWFRRLVNVFDAGALPRDQWVRQACAYLRDDPAELWWEAQVELGLASIPPTTPQDTLTWVQFQAGIVGVYMRDDYIPQLLDAFDKLRCKGVHDITIFCDQFELHLINLRKANIAMADTVVLAMRILKEMPPTTASVLRTLPRDTLHNHVELLAMARRFNVQDASVPTQVALPQVAAQDIPVVQVLQAVLQAMRMRGGMNRGGQGVTQPPPLQRLQ
jgi:hypothetical protein